MPKLNLPKAPEHQIHWGIITDECKADFKFWLSQMLDHVVTHPDHMGAVIDDIYEELTSLGYSEGYDDYAESHPGEDWD